MSRLRLVEWLSSTRSSQPAFLPASTRRIAAALALAFAWPTFIGLVIPAGAADAALLLLLCGVYCCAISGRALTGLLAVATSAFAYTYVFAPPVHELALSSAKDIANLGMFLTLASLVAGHVGIQQAQNERLHRQKQALRESESRKSAILNSALDCVVTIDHHGQIAEFNPAAEEAFGYERSEAIGARMADLLIPPSLRDAHRAAFAHYLETGEGSLLGSRIETTAMRAGGSEFPIEIAVVRVELSGPPVFTAYLRDISERREAEKAQKKAERELKRQAERSKQLALHDSLTGLSNRTLFRDRLEHGLRVTRRQSGQMAVLIMDLDRFKEINDTLGHQTGDLVLQELGARLGRTLRSSDTISRLGGDEFGVLLTGVSAAEAVEAAQRIQRAIADPVALGELQLQVDASIGIALFPDHGDEADLLVQRADVAMYLAKESNSRFALYDPERDDNEPSRLALLGELRQAFDRRELVLHYQPQVQLRTGEVAGVEALVRWQHPERGLLAPDEFIPLVERGGLVRRLTSYVLEEALSQACAWQREWHHLLIAVNVSMRNLLDSSFPDEVAGLLGRWGLDATQLALEITETSIVADPMRVRSVLERLHEMGLRLAVDDFGTGYASLAHLRRLPVDEIKIDRSFVSRMTMDGDDALIVRSTIDLGRNLGLEVVAEGVESHDVYRRLAELGCDAGQGFFFGRPMPADELIRWLDRRRQIALPQAYSPHTVAS